jgi:hypothetical protein
MEHTDTIIVPEEADNFPGVDPRPLESKSQQREGKSSSFQPQIPPETKQTTEPSPVIRQGLEQRQGRDSGAGRFSIFDSREIQADDSLEHLTDSSIIPRALESNLRTTGGNRKSQNSNIPEYNTTEPVS